MPSVNESEVKKRAFAMPLTSPAFPPGPYRFINREFFIVTYRTDPDALRDVIPAPLEMTEPIVKYEFIRMPDSTGFGDYCESGQVIPVKYIDAIQLKRDFAPLVPSYADLSANANSNSLILTDTGANIRRIVEIIRAMDTQSTVVAEVKVFQLKYANASSAARLINDTFKEETQPSQQQNLPFWMRGGQHQ